jgi:parallel beta-helix repeat protein
MQNNKILKCLIFVIVLLFISSSFTGSTLGFSIDKYQIFTHGGNTLYVGGGGLGNYSNIQDAIDNASDGDTVFVFDDSSPYYENLIIIKGIFLIGENRDTTIIDGSGYSNVIYIDADSVYISKFTIQNGEHKFPYGGINIRSNYSTISDNNLKNNFYGIDMYYSENNHIVGNNIMNNNQCGIYLEGSSNNNISENLIDSQPYNGIGFYNLSNYNNIFKNTIINNQYSGVRTTACSGNNIFSNMISNNLVGIRIEYSTNTKIFNNNLIKNTFKGAHFLGDIFSIYTNTWDGNYWNRPRVLPKPILGRSGIILIILPWINFDWNPAIEAYEI